MNVSRSYHGREPAVKPTREAILCDAPTQRTMVIRRRTLDNARTPGCPSREEFDNATTTKQRALPCEYYELRIGSISSERNARAAAAEGKVMYKGKVVQTAKRTVSNDGKVLTIWFNGIDAKGQKIDNVQVFDRK